jgi:hypothetical protein
MCKITDQILSSRDFTDGDPSLGARPERYQVVIGVIADPVPFRMGALSQAAPVTKLVAHKEKRRFYIVPTQSVQDLRGNLWVRTVVERGGNNRHYLPPPTATPQLLWREHTGH